MLEYIDAPMPYIIGVPRTTWMQTKNSRKDLIPEGITIFDVDKNEFIARDKGSMQMPFNYTLPVSIALSSVKSVKYEGKNFWIAATLNIRQAFLKMYLTLMGDITQYFQITKGSSYYSSSNIFNSSKYIKSRDIRIQGIMRELTRTQHFNVFIEKVYKFYDSIETNEIELCLKGMSMNSGTLNFDEYLKESIELVLQKLRHVIASYIILAKQILIRELLQSI
jgi:hypothetical protein